MSGIWRLAPALADAARARITWSRQDYAIAVRLPRGAPPDTLGARIDAAVGIAPAAGLLTFGSLVSASLAERRLVDVDVFAAQVETASLDGLPVAGPIFDAFYEGPLDDNDRAGFDATIRIAHDPVRRCILIRMGEVEIAAGDLVCLAPGCHVVPGDAALPLRAVLLAAAEV